MPPYGGDVPWDALPERVSGKALSFAGWCGASDVRVSCGMAEPA